MELLDLKYRPTEINTHKSNLLYTPQIGILILIKITLIVLQLPMIHLFFSGMAVAARYTIDLNWYRAKIISLPEPRMVTVFYIDYGNSETLPWDQLRILDKTFMTIPPLVR